MKEPCCVRKKIIKNLHNKKIIRTFALLLRDNTHSMIR